MGRAAALLLPLVLPFASGCDGSDAPDASTVEVRVQGVALDERAQSPVVILEERAGARRLPIWIGYPEATSIANELQSTHSPRPNTHDLAKRLIDGLEGSVARVVVTDLSAGVYYARIVLARGGQTVEVDARPSDAIAIALRMHAPVFVNELLFEKALEATGGEEGERI
jgi:bifunctional DNase/RNase